MSPKEVGAEVASRRSRSTRCYEQEKEQEMSLGGEGAGGANTTDGLVYKSAGVQQ